MKAEIISIGDELLIGQTINTNASWIGEQLSLIGASVFQVSTITDDEKHILDTLKRASKNVDLVLITGGLGPTKDDITKHTLCKYFGVKLEFKEVLFNKINDFFISRGLKILDVNRDQAMIPSNAKVLENTRGTASGMWFEKDNVIYISMPGVPYEMKGIMRDHVLPILKDKYTEELVVHRTIKTIGIGESFLAEKIADWENSLEVENIKLAYLPSPGIVKLRLSGCGKNESSIKLNLTTKIEELKSLISDYIFGYEKEELHQIIGKLLNKKNRTLATAESCTGGYVAHLITSVPGSSNYYNGSIIAYSNRIKEGILNVTETELYSYGAVSQQVVEQMAKGVLQKLNSDYSIATSGIAGPDGGTDEKPVGTIWLAVASKNNVISIKLQLGKSRQRNIKASALHALNMLRKMLEA